MVFITRRSVILSAVAALSATATLFTHPRSWAAHNPKSAEHVVIIEKFRFVPAILRVHPNDTITWANHDITSHTATAKDKSWDTGEIKKGQSKSLKITADTEMAYFCRFHPGMKASLEIIIEN